MGKLYGHSLSMVLSYWSSTPTNPYTPELNACCTLKKIGIKVAAITFHVHGDVFV